MDKLNQSAINDVFKTEPNIRAEVLFKFLVEGKSHRHIEKETVELIKNDGWSSWKITQFFGFGNKDKGKLSGLKFQNILLAIEDVDMHQFEEYHLENVFVEDEEIGNNGTDILRNIKTRVGQAKLRKNILSNYENRCALCNIDSNTLLVASHIKPWSISSQQERIDPSNTLLLCHLHDGLFENGHLYFDDNLKVIYKDEAELNRQGIITNLVFRMPNNGIPNIRYIQDHRRKHQLIAK